MRRYRIVVAYDMVKIMQSYDVHPPLYYMILHTVCSLFPGGKV